MRVCARMSGERFVRLFVQAEDLMLKFAWLARDQRALRARGGWEWKGDNKSTSEESSINYHEFMYLMWLWKCWLLIVRTWDECEEFSSHIFTLSVWSPQMSGTRRDFWALNCHQVILKTRSVNWIKIPLEFTHTREVCRLFSSAPPFFTLQSRNQLKRANKITFLHKKESLIEWTFVRWGS